MLSLGPEVVSGDWFPESKLRDSRDAAAAPAAATLPALTTAMTVEDGADPEDEDGTTEPPPIAEGIVDAGPRDLLKEAGELLLDT